MRQNVALKLQLNICLVSRATRLTSSRRQTILQSLPRRTVTRTGGLQARRQNPFHLEGTVDVGWSGLLLPRMGVGCCGAACRADVRIFHIPKSLICYAHLPCCRHNRPRPTRSFVIISLSSFFFALFLLLCLVFFFFVLCPFFCCTQAQIGNFELQSFRAGGWGTNGAAVCA